MRVFRTAAAYWPMVGREEELAFVGAALTGGRASGLVLAGAAGVGKTRLASEALRAAEAEDCATVWVVGTRAASEIPFGALAHLVPVAERVIASPLDLMRRLARTLAEQAGGRRLVFGVDDAHLLDGPSAALVGQLAATGTAFVVVTVRGGEPAPDAIVALWKDGPAEYVELQSLSREDVERLVGEVLDGEIDGGTVVRIWEATRGNALYLRELVFEGLEQGRLSLVGGLWRWHGPLAPGARLSELIEGRLGRLAAAERKLVELLAVGEPIGASTLAAVTSARALEEMERRGLVEVGREGRRLQARLGHPLYGAVLRARTFAPRVTAASGVLADALARNGARRREDLLRLATWRLESGGTAEPDLMLAAARRAEALFDPVLAERLARAAGQAGGGAAAEHALAEALRVQGRFEEAEQLFARLERGVANDRERARLTWARALNLFWGLRRPSESDAVILSAQRSAVDPAARDELAALHGWVLFFSGRPAEALAALGDIHARAQVGDAVGVRAAITAAHCLAIVGRASEGMAVAERWRKPALGVTDEMPLAPTQLQSARALALMLAGRLAEAEAVAAQQYRAFLSERTQEGRGIWAMIVGYVALARGRPRTAARRLRESAALFRDFDPLGGISWPLAFLAQAAAQTGDAEAAAAALAEADAAHWEGAGVWDCDLGLARAWTAAARGEQSLARTLAATAAETAEAAGAHGFAVVALDDLARLGDAPAAAARLAQLPVDGELARACSAHAAGLAAGDGRALERAALAFEAIGADLRAAEAQSSAAAAYRTAGRSASARAAAARAGVLAARCEGARTPALTAIAEREELTAREREVAALAARGLSSREIAARLVVSVRTIDNHLQHAYRKLGVTSRTELRTLL